MKSILILTTGGTIDKDYAAGGVVRNFSFSAIPAAQSILEQIAPSLDYHIETLLQKDSTDLTSDDRARIHDTCQSSAASRIVITHGTDTILATAEALSSITDKTIVLTGAMKPYKFIDSDAVFNLGTAVAGAQTLPHGVYIAMSGLLLPWRQIEKRYDDSRNYFTQKQS